MSREITSLLSGFGTSLCTTGCPALDKKRKLLLQASPEQKSIPHARLRQKRVNFGKQGRGWDAGGLERQNFWMRFCWRRSYCPFTHSCSAGRFCRSFYYTMPTMASPKTRPGRPKSRSHIQVGSLGVGSFHTTPIRPPASPQFLMEWSGSLM